MEELIGKQFKRNKYGISSWIDTIQSIRIIYQYTMIDGYYYLIPKIYIIGENNNVPYTLDEIVLIK